MIQFPQSFGHVLLVRKEIFTQSCWVDQQGKRKHKLFCAMPPSLPSVRLLPCQGVGFGGEGGGEGAEEETVTVAEMGVRAVVLLPG
jgi:hypothetical protein